jgi:fructose-1,6-bisphosphatase II
MDRNLALELVRVTEGAAIESARWLGRGDRDAADAAATEAMRSRLAYVEMDGTVVIGEGERDEAPMLYIGERVGNGQPPKVDIACDPLEGTNSVAFARPNAMTVIALAEEGNFLKAPDTYMEKIAVGVPAVDAVDFSAPPEENLPRIAEAYGYDLNELTVVVLDRERHEDLIERVRKIGCRVKLIPDGDVDAAVACALPGTGVDVLMGTGGAPEGVLAAAALRCLGGALWGQLRPRSREEASRAERMGASLSRVYRENELARGDSVVFAATGVTDGDLLHGVQFFHDGARTESTVMRASSGTVRRITATHRADSDTPWPVR